MKKLILIILILSLNFVSCKKANGSSETSLTANTAFDQLLNDFNEAKLKLNPIDATFAGDKRYNDLFQITISREYQIEKINFYSKYKNKINSFADNDLTESQQMSKAILIWDCDIVLEQSTYKNEVLLPIDQMWSIHLVMGQFASGTSAQPFKTVKDYENWLSRLSKYNSWLQMAIDRMKEGIEQGYVLPKSLIEKVIPQFEELAFVKKSTDGTANYSEHLFYTPIKIFPKTFSAADRSRLEAAYTDILEEKLIPSFKAMHDFLRNVYLKSGRKSSGISDIPNGKDYYQYAIKNYTTTKMTADEIHELGLKEVARILSEMEKVKLKVGFKGSLKDFFDFVRNDKVLMPYNNPKQIIDNFNSIHDRMKPQLEKLFKNKPETPFIVKQTEKFREASASAEYNQGSLDGTRPGIFYTPIPDAKKYNVLSDEALFLHEAIPGHYYQISLTQENKALPNFRKTLWYSAYGEGWALYTESLGKELGLYTNPYQYFGMLGLEMHRAIRLVVDTGIHVKGWSREKAIQYSLENEAESKESITSEIERYMANPGQALSYKIGQLKIRELRAKAEKEFGNKFDIKEFHHKVLETGCIPLALLEKKINRWIDTAK